MEPTRGSVETPTDRQKDELEVLESIYPGSVKDLRRTDKRDGYPLEVKIKLLPQASMSRADIHVGLSLIIKCSLHYPNVVPEISLGKAKGISNVQMEMLKKELDKVAAKSVGEVMIHTLCQHVEEFLYLYNKPPTESFYQQMLSKQQEQMKKQNEQQRLKEERERQEHAEIVAEEMKRQQEGLREDAKRRRQNQERGDSRSSTEYGSPPYGSMMIERSQRISLDERPTSASYLSSPSKTKRVSSATISRGPGDQFDSRASAINHVSRMSDSESEESCRDDDDDDEGDEIPCMPSKSSRFQEEFKQFKRLGRGAYGDVIRARNKLDTCFYAIKRIPLNSNHKRLMKKMTREVKLLSRLNHENVVRYYTSWLETAEQQDTSETSSATLERSSDLSVTPRSSAPARGARRGLDSVDGQSDVSWAVSPAGTADVESDDDNDDIGDDDDDDDDDDFFGGSFLMMTSESEDEEDASPVCENKAVTEDDSIIFEDTSPTENSGKGETTPVRQPRSKTPASQFKPRQIKFLYIQMEYCERKTLRKLIDGGELFKNEMWKWQLLREILEGLQHIHDKGMIHRDLKPMNIFLDSQNHVKIGDFGLATTGLKTSPSSGVMNVSGVSAAGLGDGDTSMNRPDGAMTGTVGTAMYVAPEVLDQYCRYNEKVDLYSLGVIFFEMCYKMGTGTERAHVLPALRDKSINMPNDFIYRTFSSAKEKKNHDDQIHVIRWLLNHDPELRPSCHELLRSDYLPALPEDKIDAHEILRKTISAPNSHAFKYMVNTIFSSPAQQPTELCYDVEAYKAQPYSRSRALAQRYVTESLEKIFQRHGAVVLTLPLLMPKSVMYEGLDAYSCLMDHGGCLVSLPYDTRVPFARYVSRTGVTDLKRYSFDRVFRENRVSGVHPRELVACSFDIASSSLTSRLPDVEILRVVSEIIAEFPGLNSCRVYHLRLNHSSLVRAILQYCEIPESLHAQVLSILGDFKAEKQRRETIQNRLCSLSLSSKVLEQLFSFLEHEDTLQHIKALLLPITKARGQAASLAKEGLHDLECILSQIETVGCKFRSVISLGLLSHMNQYSGMLFQVVSDVKLRNKVSLDVLAVGGRYDRVLDKLKRADKESVRASLVGVTVAYDKIVNAAESHESTVIPSIADVLICSVGHRSQIKERLAIARELWEVGVAVEVSDGRREGLEEEKEYCRENRIGLLIVQKESDISVVKVQSNRIDKVVKKDITSMAELVEFFLQKIHNKAESPDTCPPVMIKSQTSLQTVSEGGGGGVVITPSTSSLLPPYNISYVLQESNKPAKNTKRLYESQIITGITSSLPLISSRCRVEVVAVELGSAAVKSLASSLDVSKDAAAYTASASNAAKEYPRFKKYLMKITDEIFELKYESKLTTSPAFIVIILYSLHEDMHKILL